MARGCALADRLLVVRAKPRRSWGETAWDCARSGAVLPLAVLPLRLLPSAGLVALLDEQRDEGWLVLRSPRLRRSAVDLLVELAAKGAVSGGELAVRARPP